ncbi:MAG: cysteine desulfurase family protein [Patescibacteria group bacterium]
MKKSKKIYLDYASATPLEKSVFSVMSKALRGEFANPSAIHDLGVHCKNMIEVYRKTIAQVLNAHSDEIVFTSGATESNNLAINGIVKKYAEDFFRSSGKVTRPLKNLPHIVTTNIEHASVLEVCKYLEKNKLAEVAYVPVEENGIVDPKNIKKALRPETILVSVMYANNEIGTIQPIREIAKEIRHYNKLHNTKILFHIDATQAINYLDINVEKLGIDMMSFNAGKIYGPKGIGILYIKRKTPISKIIFGGDQERGLRAGTENLASIAGFAEALKITEKIKEKEVKRLKKLQDYFIREIISKTDNIFRSSGEVSQTIKNSQFCEIIINGDRENRLPNNINVTIPKIPSDLLVIELSARGIMVSAKSACKSGEEGESYVIRAIKPEANQETGSIRFSLGRMTKKEDIDFTLKSLKEILTKLKKWYT